MTQQPPSPRRAGARVQCLRCLQTIQSLHVHNYVTCACGDISVDGGSHYRHMSYADGARYRVLDPEPPELETP